MLLKILLTGLLICCSTRAADEVPKLTAEEKEQVTAAILEVYSTKDMRDQLTEKLTQVQEQYAKLLSRLQVKYKRNCSISPLTREFTCGPTKDTDATKDQQTRSK